MWQRFDEACEPAALIRVQGFMDLSERRDPRSARRRYIGEGCFERLVERRGIESVVRQRCRDAVLGFFQAWPQRAEALP